MWKAPSGFKVPIMAAVALSFMVLFGTGTEASTAYTGGGEMVARGSLADPTIWRSNSGNEPNQTSLTLVVSGEGTKGITLAPQDVVFLMDHSGSLGTYDPQVLRILATHRYVDNMVSPFDRACLIKFDSIATPFNHLTSAYAQVHADLDALAMTEPQGQTNFQAGIGSATDELIAHGTEGNQKIIILFTDGTPDPPEKNVSLAQMGALVDNAIKVYTIGLGPMVDESLLWWMANYTGGDYFLASEASELIDIYLRISDQFYDYTGGTNCTIRARIDPEIDYLDGSADKTQNFSSEKDDDGWLLLWSVGDLMIGQNWSVTFNITSVSGDGRLSLFAKGSYMEYIDWRGEKRTADLPEVYITIIRSLPPPLPPPPTPPPPAPLAPIPPPPSVPVVAPSINVAPVLTAAPNITPVTVGQAASVPVEYMLAGLAALGIAERVKIKKKLIEKQRVSVGA